MAEVVLSGSTESFPDYVEIVGGIAGVGALIAVGV
jgi:hypothetical protein